MTWRLFALLDTFNWLLSIVLQLPSLKKRWNYIYQNENDTHSLFKKKKGVSQNKLLSAIQKTWFLKCGVVVIVALTEESWKKSSWSHLSDWPASKLCGTARLWLSRAPVVSVPFKTKKYMDGCPFARKLSLFLVCYRKGTITFKV